MQLARFSLFLLLLSAAVVQAQSVTKSTFDKLNRVQEMMGVEQHAAARELLEVLVAETRDRPYDFAVANQYLAHTSVVLDDVARARSALRDALQVAELPRQMRTDMSLFYGTILLGEGDYEEARVVLEEWFAAEERPKPSQIFSAAYANYMSGDIARAEFLVTRALAMSTVPKEAWYQLYYRILFDLKKFGDAELVLQGMITRNPSNAAYWRMLVNHYLLLERSNDALATFMVAYNNKSIKDQSDLERIVTLYGFVDVPEKGARLLEGWIVDGELESDAETLKQLGNLWLLARERQQALDALEKAAALSPDGRTFVMLGGIYFEDEDWAKAYSAYQDALRVGGLEDEPRVYLLAGVSAYHAGNEEGARRALRAAAESEEYRSQAESVLRQLDTS